MPDFTSNLPDTHFRVPQRTLRALLENCRQEQFTGLIRLRYPSGMDLVSTFLDGVQTGLYGCHTQNMEVIPRQSWAYSMDRPDASIAILRLSVEALRLIRTAHEVPVVHLEQFHDTYEELSDRVAGWARGQTPILLSAQTDSSYRIYLIPGNGLPIIEELVIEGGQARFSITDVTFPSVLCGADYRIFWHESDCNHDLWQDHEMRYAFALLTRMVLNRFSQLAGRVLAERVCERLTAWLREGSWDIGITINGLSNRHYFESFQQARALYLEIMRRFNDESRLAIGLRMAEGLWWDTLVKMDVYQRGFLKRHLYDLGGLDHGESARRFGS
jgi:hypothetical protein